MARHGALASWNSRTRLFTPDDAYLPLTGGGGDAQPKSQWAVTEPPKRRSPRIKVLVTLVACAAALFGMLLISKTPYPYTSTWLARQRVSRFQELDIRRYVNGPPTMNYTDNLRDDTLYITGWTNGGFTNQVMSYTNLLLLSHLTSRIPIMPHFSPAPGHLDLTAGLMPFGDVFDLARLAKAMHSPVLDWKDVKDAGSAEVEAVGCWSSWMGGGSEGPAPADMPEDLKLDISYTAVPRTYDLLQDGEGHVSLAKLMLLGFPTGRSEALFDNPPLPSPQSQAVLEPDDRLLCFDNLYYVGLARAYEFDYDWSPAWRLVGSHMRWTPRLDGMARRRLNRHFGAPIDGPVPPYISVHLRRDDFRIHCESGSTSCLPSVAHILARVRALREELFYRTGVRTERTLITSDERDPEWWREVRENGMTWIDHGAEGTEEAFGLWSPVLLDAVFHSMGSAFLGTEGSTMSLLAASRVRDWNNGPTSMLRFSSEGTGDELENV